MPLTWGLSVGLRVKVVPERRIEPVTVPKGPCRTGSAASLTARGLSVEMFLTSTEKPNGSLLFTPLLVNRSLMIAGESQPSLLRSLWLWSEMRNSPPPFCTKRTIADFSAAEKRMFGSGITKVSKLARSSAAPVP